ncbi:uncharacterized protein LOC133053029 [Dama dama]|uniref:uncharacterized protein LOC133053029 n=1 Tax=Dama dama TaxID=30532 RepID=UPI002A362A1F|nr:uncharacterized protein LOC133053029 [Dama dama]
MVALLSLHLTSEGVTSEALSPKVPCYPLAVLPSAPSTLSARAQHSGSPRNGNGSPLLTPGRIDWLYLLAVQGTLKSLLQHQCTGPGNIDLQGHVCGLHPGVAAAGRCSEEPPQGRHAGELQPPRLHGIPCDPATWDLQVGTRRRGGRDSSWRKPTVELSRRERKLRNADVKVFPGPLEMLIRGIRNLEKKLPLEV